MSRPPPREIGKTMPFGPPLPREEEPVDERVGDDVGDEDGIRALRSSLASARSSISGLSNQLNDDRQTRVEMLERLEKRIDQKAEHIERMTAKRIARSDARNRQQYCELTGQVLELQAGQAEILLAMHQHHLAQDEDRRQQELKIAETRRLVEEAKARAAEAADEANEITGQWERAEVRRSSHAEDALAQQAALGTKAAEMALDLMAKNQAEKIAVHAHDARTEIDVRAETKRTWMRTLAAVVLAALGGGGSVWLLLAKGCGG